MGADGEDGETIYNMTPQVQFKKYRNYKSSFLY